MLLLQDLYGVEPPKLHLGVSSFLNRWASSRCWIGERAVLALDNGNVILVRGLIHDPPVMLLDEPTRGLDVVGVQTIFEYIRLRELGKAVVVCTHRLDEASDCATGSVFASGTMHRTGSSRTSTAKWS